jgi:hypothetical protein
MSPFLEMDTGSGTEVFAMYSDSGYSNYAFFQSDMTCPTGISPDSTQYVVCSIAAAKKWWMAGGGHNEHDWCAVADEKQINSSANRQCVVV